MACRGTIKELVSALCSAARIDPLDSVNQYTPQQIAERILGPGCLRRVPRKAIGGPAALVHWNGRTLILLASNVREDQVPALVAHELGELALRICGVRSPHATQEQAADEVGQALLHRSPDRDP